LCFVSQTSAQSYENSPHVEGDSASVRVYYDQRVNTTNVKKDVFVYNGPKADEVLAAVRGIVNEQQAKLATLVSKDDVNTLRGDLLALLQDQFDSQPDIIASLRALLDAYAPVHVGYWDIGVGLSNVLAGGPGLGGGGRIGGYLDMLTTGPLRHALGVRVGFEVLERDEISRQPDGRVLGQPSDRLSFHGWLEPGYEVWWLGKHVSLQLSLLLGAQAFEAGSGSRPFITYGATLAPEARIGPEDGTGIRIGVQYRIASMTRPVFDFQGLMPSLTPERTVQHVLLVYAGMYFSVFG
jgi:hypothetical protein